MVADSSGTKRSDMIDPGLLFSLTVLESGVDTVCGSISPLGVPNLI